MHRIFRMTLVIKKWLPLVAASFLFGCAQPTDLAQQHLDDELSRTLNKVDQVESNKPRDYTAFAEQAEAISKQSLEIAMESIHQVSEQIRDLAENEREIEHDIRSLEREKRDVEFERRLSEKADIKQLEKRKVDLAQQVAQLEKQKAALKEEKQTLKAKATKNKRQKQQEQAQKKQASIKQLEHTLSTMLCDYGAGLKHLPENEFVNFTLVNAGQDNEDLIYVFNKQDIQKCVMTKIDKNRLLAEAKKYAF